MKVKHLFLTLIVLFTAVSFAWGTDTDVISYSAMHDDYSAMVTDNGDYNEFTGCTFSSDAEYVGWLYYSSSSEVLGLNNLYAFGTSTSGGKVRTVTIQWAASGNLVTDSEIAVYVSDAPFSGYEEYGSISATLAGMITYDGSSSGSVNVVGDYEYVLLVGTYENAYFTQVSIEWETDTKYAITRGSGTNDSWATVTTSPTEAAPGEDVTVTFTVTKFNKRLEKFTIGDIDFNLSCWGYLEKTDKKINPTYTMTFVMPAGGPIEITTILGEIPIKPTNVVTVKEGGVAIDASTAISGVWKEFTFTLSQTSPKYDGIVTYSIGDASAIAVKDFSVNLATGNGSFKVKGVTGSSTLTVIAPKTGEVNRGEKTITLTIEPRQVALVAEYSGRYFVMSTAIAAGKAAAIEVYKDGTTYYYDPRVITDVDDVTWKALSLNEYDSELYIQNLDDQYLAMTGTNLITQAGTFLWNDEEGGRKYVPAPPAVAKGLVYNNSNGKFEASTDFTYLAKEAVIGTNFVPLNRYSTSVSSAALYDARSIVAAQVGSICLPFDVPASLFYSAGAEFFTLTGKKVSAGKLVSVDMSDPVDHLEAGKPYVFVSSGTSIDLYYIAETETNASTADDDGLVGCLAGDGRVDAIPSSDYENGDYGFKSSKLWFVGPSGSGHANPYRAFVRAGELTVSSAPARRVLMVADAATYIEDFSDALFINWDEPVYNIMGMQVGKGATGVLIQNGKKFFVR